MQMKIFLMANVGFKIILSLLFSLTSITYANEEVEELKCKCFEVYITDDISLSTTINSLDIDESRVQIIYEIKL